MATCIRRLKVVNETGTSTLKPFTIVVLVNLVEVDVAAGIELSFESECPSVAWDTPFGRNARFCEPGRSHNSIGDVYLAVTFSEAVRAAGTVHTFRNGQGARGYFPEQVLAHQNDPGPMQSMAGFPL